MIFDRTPSFKRTFNFIEKMNITIKYILYNSIKFVGAKNAVIGFH